MLVRYKFNDSDDKYGDLVCELTEFFDKYDLNNMSYEWFKTYLYNDLDVFSDKDILQIAFRKPGATRGGIQLERIDSNKFRIKSIHFNEDVCFGEFACYDEKLREASKKYIGEILDFSDVKLMNNIVRR